MLIHQLSMLTTRDDLNGLNASTGSVVPSMGPNPSHGYIGRGTPIPWGGGPNPSHGYIGRGTPIPWVGSPHDPSPSWDDHFWDPFWACTYDI